VPYTTGVVALQTSRVNYLGLRLNCDKYTSSLCCDVVSLISPSQSRDCDCVWFRFTRGCHGRRPSTVDQRRQDNSTILQLAFAFSVPAPWQLQLAAWSVCSGGCRQTAGRQKMWRWASSCCLLTACVSSHSHQTSTTTTQDDRLNTSSSLSSLQLVRGVASSTPLKRTHWLTSTATSGHKGRHSLAFLYGRLYGEISGDTLTGRETATSTCQWQIHYDFFSHESPFHERWKTVSSALDKMV